VPLVTLVRCVSANYSMIMKRPVVYTIAIACGLAFSPLQAPAQTGTSASSTTAAPKPLGSADRKFIKDSGEQVLAITRLVDLTKHKVPGSEDLKKMNAKIASDMDKIWGEVGAIAQARKVDLPKTEASASDKAQVDKIRKTADDKFDKTLLKALEKETKKVVQIFEAGDKSVQEQELKTVVANWTPMLKKHAEDAAAAELEAAKKK
jgi:hypothetical protein